MPLILTNENETPQADTEGLEAGKGKQRALQRSQSTDYKSFRLPHLLTLRFFSAASFYPGYHGLTTMAELQTDHLNNPVTDDVPSEKEDKWIDSDAGVVQERAGKILKSAAIEVCL